MTAIKVLGVLLLLFALLSVRISHADRGVGINVSRISIADSLAQGGGYNLPAFAVINTGDEATEYELLMITVANQIQLRPDLDWLEFQPRRFWLSPGELQHVSTKLVVPSGADTGDYYAQILAQPVREGSGATIGIAAATQLTFTVEPSSWLAAQRLRISRFLRDIEPWSYVVEGLFLAGGLIYLAARYSPVRLRNPFERRH